MNSSVSFALQYDCREPRVVCTNYFAQRCGGVEVAELEFQTRLQLSASYKVFSCSGRLSENHRLRLMDPQLPASDDNSTGGTWPRRAAKVSNIQNMTYPRTDISNINKACASCR